MEFCLCMEQGNIDAQELMSEATVSRVDMEAIHSMGVANDSQIALQHCSKNLTVELTARCEKHNGKTT